MSAVDFAKTPEGRLTSWILHNSQPMTHVKLQKLAFYCVGICSVFACNSEFENIRFFSVSGPVNRPIFDAFQEYGSEQIKRPIMNTVVTYEVECALRATLDVYGCMTSWELREQSNIDLDRIEVRWEHRSKCIPHSMLAAMFREKYGTSPIYAPEYSGAQWSAALDGIPVRRFQTFLDMVDWARERCGERVIKQQTTETNV